MATLTGVGYRTMPFLSSPARYALSPRFQGLQKTAALFSTNAKTSYYKTVGGLKYDRSALEAAAKAGKGDGCVSLADAEKLFAEMVDGPGVTKIEFRTAFKILADYTFTDEARDSFIASLAKAK